MIYKYDSLTIQVSKVGVKKGWCGNQSSAKYLYEEINNNDEVVYSHYISPETVKRLYPAAL